MVSTVSCVHGQWDRFRSRPFLKKPRPVRRKIGVLHTFRRNRPCYRRVAHVNDMGSRQMRVCDPKMSKNDPKTVEI